MRSSLNRVNRVNLLIAALVMVVHTSAIRASDIPEKSTRKVDSASQVDESHLGEFGKMSLARLHRKFTKLGGDERKDAFNRLNSLKALLERRFIRRGMGKKQLQAILGRPDDKIDLADQPPFWTYRKLLYSDCYIYFDDAGRISKIHWHFDRDTDKLSDQDHVY